MIKTLVIAGPTASGKSAVALALAERVGGAVINADSLQVYRDLRILSARPTAEEEARAPHRLYGYRDGATPCTAAGWAADAAAAVRDAAAAGQVPILVGGTGLYLSALMDGLSAVPPVPEASRAAAEALREAEGLAGLYAPLVKADPESAAVLEPANPQRMLRAYAVWHATGRTLRQWQAGGLTSPLPEGRFLTVTLLPERDLLYRACDRRFLEMMARGALEEVKTLLAKGYPDDATVMKAVGVPELRAHLNGALTLDEAIALAQQHTRNYAKRQLTWLRRRMHGSHAFSFSEFHHPATHHEIMSCVDAFLLKSPDF